MRKLFKHTDPDGDTTRLETTLTSPEGDSQWAVRVETGEERRVFTAYLDRAAMERLSAAILAELGTAPADPQASTRRAQALVAASRTVAATVGSDAVIATAREFERYLSGETDAPPPAAEDAEYEIPGDVVECRSCGHPHYAQIPTVCTQRHTKPCGCKAAPCDDCGHPRHVNMACGMPQTTENGRPARCRCGLEETAEAVQEKCADCGHAPHTGMACGRLRHPEKGDVMERCRCGLEETAAAVAASIPLKVSLPCTVMSNGDHTLITCGSCGIAHVCRTTVKPAVAPADCRECSHSHVQGGTCHVYVISPAGRRVICGCQQ